MNPKQPLEVELELTTSETAGPIRNFWPLYLHDIASYERSLPNAHGVLLDDDTVTTWDQVAERQAPWWRNPETLLPYIIRVGGAPAGFCLVARGAHVPNQVADYTVYELFLSHAWRGTTVASLALRETFERHKGTWEVATWPTATRAIAFWRKVLPVHATGPVDETQGEHPFGQRVIFRFRNDGG